MQAPSGVNERLDRHLDLLLPVSNVVAVVAVVVVSMERLDACESAKSCMAGQHAMHRGSLVTSLRALTDQTTCDEQGLPLITPAHSYPFPLHSLTFSSCTSLAVPWEATRRVSGLRMPPPSAPCCADACSWSSCSLCLFLAVTKIHTASASSTAAPAPPQVPAIAATCWVAPESGVLGGCPVFNTVPWPPFPSGPSWAGLEAGSDPRSPAGGVMISHLKCLGSPHEGVASPGRCRQGTRSVAIL